MNFSRDAIIGFLVLILLGIGTLWYMTTRPLPATPNVPVATTTPATATEPLHITEHAQYYDVDAQYPGSTMLSQSAGTQADAAAIAQMKQWDEDTITQFKTDSGLNNLTPQDIQTQGLGPNRKYALTITYEAHSSSANVSYVFQVFEDTLGAHPNTTYKTFVFDSTNGKSLGLSDVFTPGFDYATALSTLSRAKLPAQIAAAEQIDVSQVDTGMLDAGTTADPANFQDFYFDGMNFVLLFPPYQVGPYVLGLVTLQIPASTVSGLKTQYP